jgi:hypothetical protein
MKKYVFSICIAVALMLSSFGFAYAAFKDKTSFLGSSFTVGSADIKLLVDLTGGTDTPNLTDQKTAPSFSNITSNWSQNYLLKIYNNAGSTLQLVSNADYLTANDPDDLRTYLFVEMFPWNDTNNNGTVEDGELGTTLGRKNFIKWKSEGISLGNLITGEVKGLVLKFSTDALADTKQGKTGIFDFMFEATGL